MTMQAIIYMLLTSDRSYLVRLGKRVTKAHSRRTKAKFFTKNCSPISEDFLAEIDVAFKKSDILCAFEVLTVDNLNKQQSDLINLFETSVRVLVNFYGTEQVDEFQGKEPKVDGIIDKEEVMKDLPYFLLDSKDVFQCHNKKNGPGCC